MPRTRIRWLTRHLRSALPFRFSPIGEGLRRGSKGLFRNQKQQALLTCSSPNPAGHPGSLPVTRCIFHHQVDDLRALLRKRRVQQPEWTKPHLVTDGDRQAISAPSSSLLQLVALQRRPALIRFTRLFHWWPEAHQEATRLERNERLLV